MVVVAVDSFLKFTFTVFPLFYVVDQETQIIYRRKEDILKIDTQANGVTRSGQFVLPIGTNFVTNRDESRIVTPTLYKSLF